MTRRRRLLLLLAAFAQLAAACGVLGSAWWLTKAWPASSGELPADLTGEDVAVPWPGGTMRAWVCEASGKEGAVLLLHGWRGSRRAVLGRARMLLGAGYSVVLPDLPAHGESTGDSVTFGIDEGAAVDALLELMRTRFADQPLAVIGISLGGVELLMARRDVPLRAVVLESVFPTLAQAVDDRMRRFLSPAGTLLTPLLTTAVYAIRGTSPDSVRPIDLIGSLECPVYCLHGSEDRSTPIEEARALFNAAREPKEFWEVEGVAHQDLHKAARRDYESRILDFLATCLGKQQVAPHSLR